LGRKREMPPSQQLVILIGKQSLGKPLDKVRRAAKVCGPN